MWDLIVSFLIIAYLFTFYHSKNCCNSAISFLIELILPETLSRLSVVSFWIRLYENLFETASLALPGFPRFVI